MTRTRLLSAATVVPTLAGLAGAGAHSAAAAPSVPAPPKTSLPAQLDVAEPYVPQRLCSPDAKPGVRAFAQLMAKTYKQYDYGISRNCNSGVTEHSEGRALDWMLNGNDPKQRAIAQSVVDWLVAPDAKGNQGAMARRFGIMYIIWDRKIWGSYAMSAGWRPYSGASPHTDHIHFSFSWDGAYGRTSWWTKKALTVPITDPKVTTGALGGKIVAPPASVKPIEAYKGTVLRSGSTGDAVKALQSTLGVSVDGEFGPKTLSALKEFQANNRIPQTGITDKATWDALMAGVSKVNTTALRPFVGQTLRLGSHGDAVKALQTFLGVESDGQFGSVTLTALKNYQRANSIPETGVTDAATWKLLVGSTGATAAPKPSASSSSSSSTAKPSASTTPKASSTPSAKPSTKASASAQSKAAASSSARPWLSIAQAADLKVGSTGSSVVALQKLLGITADGQFGSKTAQAIRSFQSRIGLKVDGVVGPLTLGALRRGDSGSGAGSGSSGSSGSTSGGSSSSTALKLGDTGSRVKVLQGYLGLSADGQFGAKTQSAVKTFQARIGLTADGVVGSQTWTALEKAVRDRASRTSERPSTGSTSGGSSSTKEGDELNFGDSGAGVKALQRYLGIAADGEFGPGTLSALKAFQSRQGLTADGVVGSRTWAALRNPSSSGGSSGGGVNPDSIVSIAKRFQGLPYIWGGSTPAGFDCSGFTQYVFNQVGLSIPRVAEDQRQALTRVYSPRVGDLVFFGFPAHHVGIYLGNGMMIDSPRTGSSISIRPVYNDNVSYGRVAGVNPARATGEAQISNELASNSGLSVTSAFAKTGSTIDMDAAQVSTGTPADALRLGDTGAEVRQLQAQLKIVGVDGTYGPATKDAVVSFQRSHNLPVTGEADEATRVALNAAANRTEKVGQRVLKPGATGAEVTTLQEWLGIKSDGLFGPRTEEAVKAFQASVHLTRTGVVAAPTWDAINRRLTA